ncbi:hypothetical protein NC653_008055 [Populus alba x Populus x berolinensis]|uniref:Pectinesterase catalytic domain-containing protein n=1 Tax=Populus alba x Populus x berolinensis TaxID=444605 RepID=A0AAD6R6T5_9ROSI|nr:hypothetical protein NC653_008055 [Populus alba x Populus x berolinensis]
MAGLDLMQICGSEMKALWQISRPSAPSNWWNKVCPGASIPPRTSGAGDGSRKTIVPGNKSFAKDGLGTWKTATFSECQPYPAHGLVKSFLSSNWYILSNFGIALIRCFHCLVPLLTQMDSSPSPLDLPTPPVRKATRLLQSELILIGQSILHNCTATVDFLFGLWISCDPKLLDHCPKAKSKPIQHGTAEWQEREGSTRRSCHYHNCRIVPEQKLVPERLKIKTYLGRPWKAYSRAVVMESQLADIIQPDGWAPWSGNQFLDTLPYLLRRVRQRALVAATNRRVRAVVRVKRRVKQFAKRPPFPMFQKGLRIMVPL